LLQDEVAQRTQEQFAPRVWSSGNTTTKTLGSFDFPFSAARRYDDLDLFDAARRYVDEILPSVDDEQLVGTSD
jgi:hypothetical protein